MGVRYIKHPVIARRERSEGRGNPRHAMDAFGECGSLPDSQWIATGFALGLKNKDALANDRYSKRGRSLLLSVFTL